jgi:multidrug resistance efflux pump
MLSFHRTGWTVVFLLAAGPAWGQDHTLPYAQVGASLTYAEAEVRILNAAVADRAFDIGFTQRTAEHVEAILSRAKKNIDRAQTLAPAKYQRLESRFLALREQVVQAERQLARFNEVLAAEYAKLTAEEDEDEDEDEDEEGEEVDAEPVTADWNAIKTEVRWLFQDVTVARKSYAALGRSLGVKALARPRAVRGKRPMDAQ